MTTYETVDHALVAFFALDGDNVVADLANLLEVQAWFGALAADASDTVLDYLDSGAERT